MSSNGSGCMPRNTFRKWHTRNDDTAGPTFHRSSSSYFLLHWIGFHFFANRHVPAGYPLAFLAVLLIVYIFSPAGAIPGKM
jgi:hypothetical protein